MKYQKGNLAMKVIKLSISLNVDVYEAIEREALERKLNGPELVRHILSDYALAGNYLSSSQKTWLKLYRELSDEVADYADQIVVRDGFSEDLTAKAVQMAQNDETWLNRYRICIGSGDVFGKDNPAKTSLNQNIGYRVRLAVNGEVIKNAKGRAVTGSAKGLVIKSFSKLRKT